MSSLTPAVFDVTRFMEIGQPEQVLKEPRIQPLGSETRHKIDWAMNKCSAGAADLRRQGGNIEALRARLILEETSEFLDALQKGDKVEATDALVDLLYVTIGAGIALGLPLAEAWEKVQAANLAKYPRCEHCFPPGSGLGQPVVGDGGMGKCPICAGKGRIVLRDAGGKVIKPEGWQAPDIASLFP